MKFLVCHAFMHNPSGKYQTILGARHKMYLVSLHQEKNKPGIRGQASYGIQEHYEDK